eukprot:COSAG01_NODE_29099_length_645_cov_1.227106_2_plen_108_part_00
MIGTLSQLCTLDLSACPGVESVEELGSCLALQELDLSYTTATAHLTELLCLGPNNRTKHVGCWKLRSLTIRGASKAAKDSARELQKHLPGLCVCEKPFTGDSLALRP